MKLSVEFPSVAYREGPDAVRRLGQAIERTGYDHIDVFDHVMMGFPLEGRPPRSSRPAPGLSTRSSTCSAPFMLGSERRWAD